MDKLSLSQKTWTDQEAMSLAIDQAYKARGLVSPDPLVGAVILNKNRKLLSTGFYARYGALHAEKVALDKLKKKSVLEGSHLFVTLEPCSHFGKNPPCVKSLIKYPWKSITYGIEDPNPKVNQRGVAELKKHGYLVKKSRFFQVELQRLYEAFTWNMKKQQAFFALKTASSLDGVAGLSHGESQWITSASSRDLNQELRQSFTAVLIGLDTFLQDNPRLNARIKGFNKTNKVILLDPEGCSFDLIASSRLAEVRPLKNIYVLSEKKEKRAFSQMSLPYLSKKEKKIDLKALSYQLYQENIDSVLVEGGMRTFVEFLEQKASSRIYQFINPSFLGGVKGRYWTEGLSISSLKDRIKIKNLEILKNQPDLCITGVLL